MTIEQIMRQMKIVETAFISAKKNKVIKVNIPIKMLFCIIGRLNSNQKTKGKPIKNRLTFKKNLLKCTIRLIEKGHEGVSRHLFSAREKESPAVSSFQFR